MSDKGENTSPELKGEAWRNKIQSGNLENLQSYANYALTRVSRTFALNIRVLPSPLREQVLLAYLFCRMADTLEDDANLDPQKKLILLKSFDSLFLNNTHNPNSFASLQSQLPLEWKKSHNWDRFITFHGNHLFTLFNTLSASARTYVTRWVREMLHGMMLFTERQLKPDYHGNLIQSEKDLDDYCYYVAGTVGMMLCDLFFLHSSLISSRRKQFLESKAVSFGLALQMTNILKDIREDSKRQISFIPSTLLAKPTLDSENKMPDIINGLMLRTLIHFENAIAYIEALPVLEPRIRLFCLWPLFMALESLVEVAKAANNPSALGKISRKQVKRIMLVTGLTCWSNTLIRYYFKSKINHLYKSLDGLEKHD